MKDIAALEAKYKELGAEIEALKSARVKEWPQIGDRYFAIDGFGSIDRIIHEQDNHDLGAKLSGNIFSTKEDATKELETRKTIAELRAQLGRKKFVTNGDNFTITISYRTNTVTSEAWAGIEGGFASTYFESQEAVRNAIKAVGADRILAASKWLSMGE